MVTGHIGIAFAVRARWPRAALPALLVATMAPDLADLVLPQAPNCRGPCGTFTHAVPAVFVLAAIAAALAWAIWHRRASTLGAAALVLAHVACDLVTGYKPYWEGGPSIGLVLYNQHVADFVLESALVTAGWVWLRRTAGAPVTATRRRTLALLILVQAAFGVWHYSPT